MLELMRAPEIMACRQCRAWFLHRRGFGWDQRWCSKGCWKVSRERRAMRKPRAARLFMSGPCVMCGEVFTAEIGGQNPQEAAKFCSLACDRRNKRQVNYANRQARASEPCTAQGCPRLRDPGDVLCVVCFDRVKRSCVGKQRLTTPQLARKRVWLHRQRPCNRGPVCPGISAYWCFICEARHMGHTTAEMRLSVTRAAAALAAGMPWERRRELSQQWRTGDKWASAAVAGG